MKFINSEVLEIQVLKLTNKNIKDIAEKNKEDYLKVIPYFFKDKITCKTPYDYISKEHLQDIIDWNCNHKRDEPIVSLKNILNEVISLSLDAVKILTPKNDK